MKVNEKELSKEFLAKAIQCETPEELVKLAKEAGIELTPEEAETYLDELDDIDLDSKQLKMVAGGSKYYPDCFDDDSGWDY